MTARVRSFPTLTLASMLKEDRQQEQQLNEKDTNSIRTSATRSILFGGEEVEVSVLTPKCKKVHLKAFKDANDDGEKTEAAVNGKLRNPMDDSSGFPRCKSDPSFKNKRQAKSSGKASCSSGSDASRRRRSTSTSKRSSRRSSTSSSLLDSSDKSKHSSRRGSYGSLRDSLKESDKSSHSVRRGSHGSLFDISKRPEKSSRSTKRVSYGSLRDSLKESGKSSRSARRGSHGSLMGGSVKATGKSRKKHYLSKENQKLHDSCPSLGGDDSDSEDEADKALAPFLSKPGLFATGTSEHSRRRASSSRSSRTTATTLSSSIIRASPSNRLLATAVTGKGHIAPRSRVYGRGTSFEASAAGNQRNATFTKSDEKQEDPALRQGLDTIGSRYDHHYFQLSAAERREERSRRRCRTCHNATPTSARRATMTVPSTNHAPSMDRSRRRRGTDGHAAVVMALTSKPGEELKFADFDHADDNEDCHACQEHHHHEEGAEKEGLPQNDHHMDVWEKRAARRHACSASGGEARSERKQRSSTSIISPQA